MLVHNTEEFGKAIKKRRKELGYTQAELASFCGCSTVYLSALENGKESAEIGRALCVVNMLGLNLVVEKRTGEPL